MEKFTSLKLPPYIYYRTYLEETYIYDVKNKHAYVFNNTAGDMIDVIARNPDISLADFLAEYAGIYDVEAELISQDALGFLDILVSNDIILSENYLPLSPETFSEIECEEEPDYFGQIDQELNLKAVTEKILLSALLEITYRCNEKCIHCYAVGCNETDKELSTQEWFSILDQLSDANVLEVTFTGGDVFMRRDFLELFDYAINKRFLVNILSNGVLATDEQLRHIAEKYPNNFAISIYGDNAKLHDSITQVHGSFAKSCRALKMLKELGVSITVNNVMMKQNADNYLGIDNLAKELGASLKLGTSICGAKNGDLSVLYNRIDDIEAMKKIAAHIEKFNVEKFHMTPVEQLYHKDIQANICAAGLNGLSINPCGELFLCNSLNIKFGDVKEDLISRQWEESPIANDFRELKIKNLSECLYCKYLDYCQFCPGIALQETGSIVKPYTEACFIARARTEIRKGGENG